MLFHLKFQNVSPAEYSYPNTSSTMSMVFKEPQAAVCTVGAYRQAQPSPLNISALETGAGVQVGLRHLQQYNSGRPSQVGLKHFHPLAEIHGTFTTYTENQKKKKKKKLVSTLK